MKEVNPLSEIWHTFLKMLKPWFENYKEVSLKSFFITHNAEEDWQKDQAMEKSKTDCQEEDLKHENVKVKENAAINCFYQ